MTKDMARPSPGEVAALEPAARADAAEPSSARTPRPLLDARLQAILDQAIERQATDLHLQGGRVFLREAAASAQGDRPLSATDLPIPSLSQLARAFQVEDDVIAQALQVRGAFDGAFSYRGFRFRVQLYRLRPRETDRRGRETAASIRVLPARPQPLEALHLPEALRPLTVLTQGLVLFTGPTGAGKTTTACALLQTLADQLPRKVVTIEDPIEYELQGGRALVTQREVPHDVPTEAEGLRQALRQDPDVIFLGELRRGPTGGETAAVLFQAASAGHLVFTTFHASGIREALEGLFWLFPPESQEAIRPSLADCLSAVVFQRLKASQLKGLRPEVQLLDLQGVPQQETAIRSMVRKGDWHMLSSYIRPVR